MLVAANARSRPTTALTGGIAPGSLLEGASRAFTQFAQISNQYAAIYSSLVTSRQFLIRVLPADEVTPP